MLSSLRATQLISSAARGWLLPVFSRSTDETGIVLSSRRQRPMTRPFSSNDDNGTKVITRSTLASHIAQDHDLSVAKSRRIVDSVLDEIVDAVSKGGSAKLSRFGTFEGVIRPARRIHHVLTGEYVVSKAGKRVRFRPMPTFKNAVNDKNEQ